MKKLMCVVIALFSCAFQEALSQAKGLTLTNPSSMERKDELIVLTRKQLEMKLGKLNNRSYVSIKHGTTPIVLQFDDLDKDGIWDEVAFLQSFRADEIVALTLQAVASRPAVKAVVRAHARQKHKNPDDTFGENLLRDSIPAGQPNTDFSKAKLPPFLTEGPAWENDRVGFRIYFDVRNTKDIWGKTTDSMVLDNVGTDPSNSYHHQSGWGMDILAVGKSLGAGSLALKHKYDGKDTIVRLGGPNMGKVHYEKIADGPIRAIAQLRYPQWKIADNLRPVSLTEQISIWGGQYFYQSKVTIQDAPTGASLITGIVNLKSKELKQDKGVVFTFDRQSENKDNLAMAIMLPATQAYKVNTTPNEHTDVTNTHYVALPIQNGKPLSYRFYSCWEQTSSLFRSEGSVTSFLKEETNRYHKPIIVK